MIVDARPDCRPAREKLLQLATTPGGGAVRRTRSTAARRCRALHFQLLAQLRVVVQIKVQVPADGGDRDGVRDGHGNRVS